MPKLSLAKLERHLYSAADRLRQEGLDAATYWFAANSALFLRKATEATHGTKKLDLDELYRIYIAIPSSMEQQAIVEQVETIDANIAVESNEFAKLSLLKSALIADLLTGRVRVPADLGFG